MKTTLLRFFVLAIGFFGTARFGHCQLILIGCTGNVTANTPPSSIVDIDIATGLATNPRNTGVFLIGGIAAQPSTGDLFGLTTIVSSPANSLVRINPLTGVVTLVGTTGLPAIVEGDLAFNPVNGMLYGVQDLGSSGIQRNLFRINPATGLGTIIGNLAVDDISAMAFSSTGTLLAIDTGTGGPNNSHLLTIDPDTALINSNIPMNINLGGTAGMAIDPMTGSAYVADGGGVGTGFLYNLDVASGMLNPIGALGVLGGASGITFIAVPEPSSMIYLCVLVFWNSVGRKPELISRTFSGLWFRRRLIRILIQFAFQRLKNLRRVAIRDLVRIHWAASS